MPTYNPTEIEPAGNKQCSNCNKKAHLWSDEYTNNGYIDPLCVHCLIEQRPNDYPQALLQEALEYTVIDEAVVLDFGYGLTAEFTFDKKQVAASRNPNETKTITQPSINRGATIRYEGNKIGTFHSKSWRNYAEEKARDEYINRR